MQLNWRGFKVIDREGEEWGRLLEVTLVPHNFDYHYLLFITQYEKDGLGNSLINVTTQELVFDVKRGILVLDGQ